MSKDYKEASAWFEELYKNNFQKNENIPWAQMKPNEHLVEYLQKHPKRGKCLVVGCGLGDDAVVLEKAGFEVTAIDISESAIKWCQERFQECDVKFIVQDIFELPNEMLGTYDFVFESLTIQSLPHNFREKIINAISSLLKEDGQILVIAHAKDEGCTKDGPPWPLHKNEIELFKENGLKEVTFSVVDEPTKISSRKFKAIYKK